MAKGLFLGFPGHGHVNPTIGLVKELIAAGDDITYYCTEEFRNKVEITGAKFIPYNAMSVEEATKGDYISSFDHLTSICNGLLETLWETKEDHYDYVIYDSMINIGDKIKKLLKIPCSIRSITTFAFSRRLLLELTQGNVNMLTNFKDKQVRKRIKIMKEKYDINFKIDFMKSLFFNKADRNIVFTSSYFQPRIQDFNDKYKFVGPSVASRNEKIDFNIENLNGRKLVYISLGTVANKNDNFYKESFKAFKDRKDLLVIMSIGRENDINSLGQIPENFKVYNYVPQLELLKMVDIFVTHGGMNSTSEGLYNNIPLVVVPQFGDQFVVAKRVEQLNAGIKLDNNKITAKQIKDAFDKICTNYNEYSKNAQLIGESLRSAGGYPRARAEIKELIELERNALLKRGIYKFL